jgi:hypothetical protein
LEVNPGTQPGLRLKARAPIAADND